MLLPLLGWLFVALELLVPTLASSRKVVQGNIIMLLLFLFLLVRWATFFLFLIGKEILLGCGSQCFVTLAYSNWRSRAWTLLDCIHCNVMKGRGEGNWLLELGYGPHWLEYVFVCEMSVLCPLCFNSHWYLDLVVAIRIFLISIILIWTEGTVL